MATFDGAVVKEQGVTFAIVVVRRGILSQHSSSIEKVRNSFQPYFPGVPVILMEQDSNGTPKYHGRTDIAKFLANTDPSRIPWKTYTVTWVKGD